MSENSLVEEYLSLMEHQGFTLEEVRALLESAIESTWAEEPTKDRLRKESAASG